MTKFHLYFTLPRQKYGSKTGEKSLAGQDRRMPAEGETTEKQPSLFLLLRVERGGNAVSRASDFTFS